MLDMQQKCDWQTIAGPDTRTTRISQGDSQSGWLLFARMLTQASGPNSGSLSTRVLSPWFEGVLTG
jgi:hypothetical protein